MERGSRKEFLKNMLTEHVKPILQNVSRIDYNNVLSNQSADLSNSFSSYNQIVNAPNQFSSPNSSLSTYPHFQQFLNPLSNPSAAPHTASSAVAGVPNAADYGPPRPSPQRPSLIPTEVLEQVFTRPHSARFKLGDEGVQEACKGLSRVLHPGDDKDLHKFGSQLCNSDGGAIAEDYLSCLQQRVPCFAVSYVQTKTFVGRFKFSNEQWQNLHIALRALRQSGVTQCRIWLDQCLWLRDASQGAWAHTGILPYVLWPVISLGDKVVQGERTTASYERMWPFVEEVAGLWSLGVLVTSEMRGKEASQGVRRSLSYNLRVKLEPEETMRLLLLNIFHGATDGLKTGWQEDVKELREMARWNVECSAQHVVVGVDWRKRIAGMERKARTVIITGLRLQQKSILSPHVHGIYLDGSRKYVRGSWSGFDEWVSGNEVGTLTRYDQILLNIGGPVGIHNVLSDKGEFQLLGQSSVTHAIWLLVAMDGRSSGITRGRVAWTKVMSGQASCLLQGSGGMEDPRIISLALSEQLGVPVKVFSVRCVRGTLEWC